MIDLSAKLETLLSLPDEECATALQARRRAWDEVDRLAPLSYGERGQIALAFERRALWSYVGFHSFDDWLSRGSDASRTTMYAAWRAARELEQDVPDLAGIPRQTVNTMVGLSSNVRSDPETVAAAKTMAPAEFEDHIATRHPDQHIERRTPMKFRTTQSQAAEIEQGIQKAISKGASSREEALAWCAHEALHQWELDDELERIALEESHDGDKIVGPTIH